MSFPPAAPWHRLHRRNGTPFFSLTLLEVVTSQLLLAGILATNAPTNPWRLGSNRRGGPKADWTPGARPRNARFFSSLSLTLLLWPEAMAAAAV